MSADAVQPCAVCGKQASHARVFLVLKIARAQVNDQRAVSQHGLELMLGGHAAIAAALGDRDVIDLNEPRETHVCLLCLGTANLLELAAPEAVTT